MKLYQLAFVLCALGLFGGCSSNRKSEDFCRTYERPKFQLSLMPEGMLADEPIVEIFEDSAGPSIRVNWSPPSSRIDEVAKYEQLKKAILQSTVWRENASSSGSLGFFSGLPRDILTVRSGELSVTLQDSDVPEKWKKSILGLANDSERDRVGEQVVPPKSDRAGG